jgi:GNAT superfamily N-acetyltransferase
MQFTTKVVGPDLTIPESWDQIYRYMSIRHHNYPEVLNYNDYFNLVRYATKDPSFAHLFYSLPVAKTRTLEYSPIFIEDNTRENCNTIHYRLVEDYCSPTWASIEFEACERHFKIDNFFPGYIGSGLGGVGQAILNEILRLARDWEVVRVINICPIDSSLPFWVKNGFKPRPDPLDPWALDLTTT